MKATLSQVVSSPIDEQLDAVTAADQTWGRADTEPSSASLRDVRLLGETMHLVRPHEVMELVSGWVAGGEKIVVANHNLHSLHLLRRLPEMRRFYDLADLVEIDSVPLIVFGKLLKFSTRVEHRCTYLDWRDLFWPLAEKSGWRVAYVGGADGVAAEAARRLQQRYPGLTISPHSGFFDATPNSEDNQRLLAALESFRPHVLFVGMGMPRQEVWIADHYAALPACVIFNVGAAFDYEAGIQVPAPRWIGRIGLEWLFRLVHNPRRLFVRYCVEPWTLVRPALADIRRYRFGAKR